MDANQPDEPRDQSASAARVRPDSAVPAPREAGEAVPPPEQTPTTGDAPGGGAAAPEAAPSVWNARTVLVVVLGVVLVLCLGGLLIGYHEYNKVAEPDRSTPESTVEQFVSATFNDRDAARAALFTCSGARLGDIAAMQADLVQRESQFSTQVRVDTANYFDQRNGSSATVAVDLKVTTAVSRSSRRWEFQLRQQSGWRICEARRVG